MSTTDLPAATHHPSSLWRHRDFRKLFTGSTASWFGSEISELAVPLLVIATLGATSTEVGLVRAAQFLPFLILTLYAGVLVDRVRRRPLMVAADLGRFVAIGAIPLLIWLGLDRMEPLYLLIFVAGSFTVVHQLADMAYLPSLVGRERVLEANSRLAAAQSAASISGQGVGGLLVAWLTAPVAVVVDALTYLVSGLTVARIRHREQPPPRAGGRRIHADVWQGLRYVLRNRYLRALLGEAASFNLANEVFMVALLLWLARDLNLSPAVIGLVISLGAVGGFAGAAIGARLSHRYGFGRTMLTTLTIGNAAPLALLAVSGGGIATVVVLAAVFVVMGFGVALANVHNVTIRQTAVPEDLRGRVNAGYRLVSYGALPLGAALGGVLAAEFGSRPAVLTGAAGIAVATVWVAMSPIPRLVTAPRAEP